MEPQSCIISSKKLPTHHIHFGILVSQHIMTRYSPYFVYFVYYMYDYLGLSVTGDTLTQDKSTQDRSSQDRSSQDSLSQDRSRQEIWLDPNFLDLTFLNQSFFGPKNSRTQMILDPKYFWTKHFLTQYLLWRKKKSGFLISIQNGFLMQHRPICTWEWSLTLTLAQLVSVSMCKLLR